MDLFFFDRYRTPTTGCIHRCVPIEMEIDTLCFKIQRYCTLDSLSSGLTSLSFSSLFKEVETKEKILCQFFFHFL